MHRQGATSRRRRLRALVLAVLLSATGLFHNVRPVAAIGASGGTVGAGVNFSCAVINGGVKCWGYNGSGQLGDGTTTNRTTPVDVIGLTSGVVSISVGNQQACALTSGGVVKCWGLNGFGAIGDGTTTNRTTPVSVPITGNVVSVHMSAHTTCAVMDDGTAQCWGDDSQGRAGIGYLVNGSITLPRDVVGGGFISIDSGGTHSCAATTSGVRCTGADVYGEMGIADTLDANTYTHAFVGVSGLGSSGIGIAPTPGTTDLAVTKTASVSSATPGTPFDYTITVTNNGTVTATNVKATDKLPAGVTFNSATILTGSGSCSNNAGTVTCTWGSVAAGASVSAKITVTP